MHPKILRNIFITPLFLCGLIGFGTFITSLVFFVKFKIREGRLVELDPCLYKSSEILVNDENKYLFQGTIGGSYNGVNYDIVFTGPWQYQLTLNNNSFTDLSTQENNKAWFDRYMGNTFDENGEKYRETIHFCKIDPDDLSDIYVCVHSDERYRSVECIGRKYGFAKGFFIAMCVLFPFQLFLVFGLCNVVQTLFKIEMSNLRISEENPVVPIDILPIELSLSYDSNGQSDSDCTTVLSISSNSF
jgi:hypothetical protein